MTELLLGDIQKHAALAAADHDAYVEHLAQPSERESNGERISQQKEADTCKRRLDELDTLLQHIYEDHVFGRLSDERYAAMSANYEAETVKLKTRYTEIQEKLSACKQKVRSAKAFADLVEQYTDITEITAELSEMLTAWAEQAERLRNGEINREDYDKWRYNYPKYDETSGYVKVPSQQFSDALVEAFEDRLKND